MEENIDREDASEPTRVEGGSRVPAGDLTQHDTQAIVESFSSPLDTIPAGNAAGPPHKRRESLLDGRDEKRSKSIHSGGGFGPTVACGVHQLQRWGEESQMPSSSHHPTEPAGGSVIDDHCDRDNVQHLSSLQPDEVKHTVFISHSGAQKDFAKQLCVELERRGFLGPFFDQRQHSLPKGKDFVPLIMEAARHCHVAVMVLSEEFLCSKWPMIELGEFHGAQQAGNRRLNMLPLFYKLSVKELDEKAIEERWMPEWRQMAEGDARIDVAKWSGAVRALRKVNGVVFGEKGPSEVAYREDIVQSIFRLSPPDLLYSSYRKMVGYSRFCEMVRDQFVRSTSGGPSYLGLYGTSGAGKTNLCKALCVEFRGEYMGRVCHVDLGEGRRMGKTWDEDVNAMSRLRRVKRILEVLCGLDKEALVRILDVDQGLTVLQRHMKWEPVFLAIDNVTDEDNSWKEAYEYVGVGFHPESRIVITSRSKENVRNLVPDIQFCVAMPCLSVMEAGELFLRSAAPSMSIFGLTTKERRFLGRCIQGCLFYDLDRSGRATRTGGDEVGLLSNVHPNDLWEMSFHPMALVALGDFFRRYFSSIDLLRWTGYLEEKEDPLWDVWKLPSGIGGIFGLQFHSLPSNQQLLFLDIAFFFGQGWNALHDDLLFMLFLLHEETVPVMKRQLQDLDRSGMITLDWNYNTNNFLDIRMHDLYLNFAEWYMTNHGLKGLENAWCVTKSRGFTSNGDMVASELVRLRMVDVSQASARVLASNSMQVLHKLEVLILESCPELRDLNLEGLVSLRCLHIRKLHNLESLTLSKSHDRTKNGGILDALEYVVLDRLESLVHGPDVRWCTSLCKYHLKDCPSMINLDTMECPHLKELELEGLSGHQLARLPNLTALHSLVYLNIDESKCDVFWSDVEASRGVRLRDLGKPYFRVVEEVIMYLRTEWVVATIDEIDLDVSQFFLHWTNSKFECQFGPKYKEEVCILRDSNGEEYQWGDL